MLVWFSRGAPQTAFRTRVPVQHFPYECECRHHIHPESPNCLLHRHSLTCPHDVRVSPKGSSLQSSHEFSQSQKPFDWRCSLQDCEISRKGQLSGLRVSIRGRLHTNAYRIVYLPVSSERL